MARRPSNLSPQVCQPRELALTILRRLREAGFLAYLAGGCVRDHLLDLEPQDYDVATEAHPKIVHSLFRRSRYVGEAFGVVLVRRRRASVEVATFRSEQVYLDGRRPSEVHFTNAQEDAQRRDFTINGLFEDPLARKPADRIIDFVGGTDDLKKKVIRAIGEPNERFGEDYLRMLRAVRFAAALDFRIESRTAQAIRRHSPLLSAISRERIGHEVRRMLTGTRPAQAVRLIQQLSLDVSTLNEPHCHGTLHVLRRMHSQATFATMLAAWMVDRHVPRNREGELVGFDLPTLSIPIARWRRALCLSNEERDQLRQVLKLLPRTLAWDQLTVPQRKRLLANPIWPQLWYLTGATAYHRAGRELVQRIKSEAHSYQDQGVSPQPLITGEDLISAGYKPGPAFGRLLQAVYDVQLEGQIDTKAQALNWVRKQLLSSGQDATDAAQ